MQIEPDALPGSPAPSETSGPELGLHGRNRQVADKLRQAADLLAVQGTDGFRVAAYRRAADTIRALDRDLGDIAGDGGREALEAIPGIGPSIAGAIVQILQTGRWGFLERLRGTAEPERLFQAVPGIGPTLARRLCSQLRIETIEELEMAAHDGRLEAVPGVGPRRAAMMRGALADMLSRVRPAGRRRQAEPEVAILLDVDREYREKSAAGRLAKIAPRRFNPTGEAWLAVLHTGRGPWHFTALYSNTARAHELGGVSDWVVIFFHTDEHPEAQRTVVTETQGGLTGRRVVRGREAECAAYYAGG